MASTPQKQDPVRQWGARFKGKKLYPCRRLSFWLWWGDRIFDLRNVRLHYGQPSERDADYSMPHDEATFRARLEELRTLVGRDRFDEVLVKSKAIA